MVFFYFFNPLLSFFFQYKTINCHTNCIKSLTIHSRESTTKAAFVERILRIQVFVHSYKKKS